MFKGGTRVCHAPPEGGDGEKTADRFQFRLNNY